MSLKGNAVLWSEMTPPPGGEDAFNDWYDRHHTPNHVAGVDGFISAMRYKADHGPHYLAIYELDAVEVLATEAYRSRKYTPDAPTRDMLSKVTGFTRYVARETRAFRGMGGAGEPLDAEIVFAAFHAVPEERTAAFDAWEEQEYIPALLESRDWRLARRLRVTDTNPWPFTHLSIHYLADPRALADEPRRRTTAWSARLAAEPWFQPHTVTYRRRNERFTKDNCAFFGR